VGFGDRGIAVCSANEEESLGGPVQAWLECRRAADRDDRRIYAQASAPAWRSPDGMRLNAVVCAAIMAGNNIMQTIIMQGVQPGLLRHVRRILSKKQFELTAM